MRQLAMVFILFLGAARPGAAQTVVQPVLRTAPLFNYEDAPATPDADDPAIWVKSAQSQAVADYRHREGCRHPRV